MPQLGILVTELANNQVAGFLQHLKLHLYHLQDVQIELVPTHRVLQSTITESVDSVCRDGTDMPYVAIQTEAWKTLLKQQL